MDFQDTVGQIITTALVLGLIMIAIGITLWIFEQLHNYSIDWQLQVSVLGLILLVFGGTALKLFQEG
jgi:hypothetical protein